MPKQTVNGVSIHFEEDGDAGGAPLLLISGLGMQLTRWAPPFVRYLVGRGFRVIRLDNRDAGLSEKFDTLGVPDIADMIATRRAGGWPTPPYPLDAMAEDAVGLLDALGIEAAHVVGASMGGMIAQLIAADHPRKTLSLTSIMSTTGHPSLPGPTPEAQAALAAPRPDPSRDREGYLDHTVRSAQIIGSPAFPVAPEVLRALAAADLDRSFAPAGFARQYAAILAAPDRREKLRGVRAPTAVIHGEQDPLVRFAGGHDTAAAIPGAELVAVPGMGHNLPPQLYELIADVITRTAARAAA